MKIALPFLLILVIEVSYSQTSEFKIITPGEHLGYACETFVNDKPKKQV